MSENYYTRHTLLAKVKDQHDQKSWEDFTYYYQRYIHMVILGLGVNPSEVDDLTQKVLLNLWEKLPEFQYQPGKCKFRTWMNTVIRNITFNYFRSSSRYKKRLDNAAAEVEEDADMPDIYQIAEENWKDHISNLAWENIQEGLNESNRDCFLLFSEGLTAEEVAEKMAVKLNTAYVMRKRVIEKLSREIRRLEDELS